MEPTTLKEIVQTILIGVCVSCAIVAVFWRLIERSMFSIRIRKIQEGQSRISKRSEHKSYQQDEQSRIRMWYKILRFLAWISEFVKITSDEEILKLLRLGGFRGPNAMTNFQAVRVVAPLFIFIVLMIEIKFVFNVDLPVPLLTFLLILPSSLGFYVPALYVKNRALNRKKAIVRSWPDALDLLLIAVEAGMSTEAAFRKTANDMIRYSKDIAEELSITTAELSYLHDRKQAFSNLAERTDSSEIRATTTALIQSERYGTPLGSSLRILAEESRNLRMREVERKAAGLSPKLTIPMVLFFMPVLIAILVVPTLIKIWGWN
jgi:tight adherence protein C